MANRVKLFRVLLVGLLGFFSVRYLLRESGIIRLRRNEILLGRRLFSLISIRSSVSEECIEYNFLGYVYLSLEYLYN